jgi:hypothetical protein
LNGRDWEARAKRGYRILYNYFKQLIAMKMRAQSRPRHPPAGQTICLWRKCLAAGA